MRMVVFEDCFEGGCVGGRDMLCAVE
jgi:hypothetical protein